jgi:heme A synthase
MNSARLTNWILPVVITLLALADGALHLTLDVVLFRGNFLGRLGPPPGAAPQAPANPPPGPPVPLPFQLNQMFLLNCIGYVLLVALLWFVLWRFGGWRRWIDVVLIVYVAITFLGWVDFGAPNPMGLGYLSKAIEILLVVALLAHVWLLSRPDVLPSVRRTSENAGLAR